MKRLLLLLPLVLLACGSAGSAEDIMTEEPFRITCTWSRGEESGDETWFIDPKLNVNVATLVLQGEEGEPVDVVKYIVTKVTPRKIVLSSEWYTPDDDKENYWRDENVIDRSSGELTPFKYELGRDMTSYPLLSQGWEGKSVDLAYEYDCQKPTRD